MEVGSQTSLDGMFPKGCILHAFSREVVLKRVVEFVVCDDQVGSEYLVIDKPKLITYRSLLP